MYEFLMGFVTHPAFGIASAGIGFLVGHQLTRVRSFEAIRLVEFNKAAAIFYAAFLDDIILIEDTEPENVDIKILERYSLTKKLGQESPGLKHRKAMILFRPYIDKADLPGFDSAWSMYHEWVMHYTDEKNTDNIYDFKSHLEKLLEYARPK